MLLPWQDLAFLTSGVHIWPFPADMTLLRIPPTRLGHPFKELPSSGNLVPVRQPSLHQLSVISLPVQQCAYLLPRHQALIATVNNAEVSYINKQGGHIPFHPASDSRPIFVVAQPQYSVNSQTLIGPP